ncbi:MAG: sulfur carrier protein ThiS [Bacteroidetes bacterium]|nr:sulfur carrier protein ThiS [Bacteroidota bacterium]
MQITINNEPTETTEAVVLLSILQERSMAEKKGIAVAVNETVVPRKSWDEFTLKPNDKILIIKATQGG